jgi:hypothetical protein
VVDGGNHLPAGAARCGPRTPQRAGQAAVARLGRFEPIRAVAFRGERRGMLAAAMRLGGLKSTFVPPIGMDYRDAVSRNLSQYDIVPPERRDYHVSIGTSRSI